MLQIRRMLKSQAGFTWVELMIVVVILAILTGIAILNSGGAGYDAQIAESKEDVNSICTALKVFKMKTGAYPLTDKAGDNTTGLKALTHQNGKYSPVLDSVPNDPFGTNYTYSSNAIGSTATLSNSDPDSTTKITVNLQ